MAKIQSPFYKSKLECPVCKTINEFESIEQGAYIETGNEADFTIRPGKWADPSFRKFNPLLHFAATCGRCFYTREFDASYKEWKNDSNFKSYRLPGQAKRHLEILNTHNSLISILGRHIDQDNYPAETALIKLLLAVFDETLLDHPSSLAIARFYLRIAWLFREMEDNKSARGTADSVLDEIQSRIDGMWKNIDDFADHFQPLRQRLRGDLDMIVVENHPHGISEILNDAIENVRKSWADSTRRMENLQAVFDQFKEEFGDAAENGKGPGFGVYPDFNEFLLALKPAWEEIPVDEIEALSLALNYYLDAYKKGGEIKPGLRQLRAVYLIAELSLRVDDQEAAREHFRHAGKIARDLIVKHKNNKSICDVAREILENSLQQGRMAEKTEQVSS